MKTDTIFYSLFQEFPSFFFELIDRPPDEATAYEFTSREIKQLAFRFVRQTINKIQRESMLLPEPNIDSFIELLTQQRSLFGTEQLTELAQLIEPLSDEIDVLSEAISSWAENYPSIQEAQAQLLEPLPPVKASEKAAVTRESSESQLRDRLNKQALKNAILL